MATPVVQFFPYQTTLRRPVYQVWIPVLIGFMVICCESTPVMGGARTSQWMTHIWPSELGPSNSNFFGEVHHILRKIGHFCGYGTLGLMLCKAWQRSVRTYMKMLGTQLMIAASALALSCTFLVACLDEWHQSFIPGRTSTGLDVLIDTCGALLFNMIFWTIRARRRAALLDQRAALLDQHFHQPYGRMLRPAGLR